MKETNAPFKQANVWKAISGSYICWAFLALILFDVGSRLTFDMWSLDKYASANRSAIWWATKDFRSTSVKPDVVLLGSSLMMAALHGGDATHLNLPQNVVYHHRSALLEELLSRKQKTSVNTFAFAIGGQMVSDASVIATTLLKGDKKPAVLVYGVAPRDFMDNTLTSPASTETFRYLAKVGDLSELGFSARPAFWDRFEYLGGRVSFFYDHRQDFVYLQNRYCKQLLTHLVPGLEFDNVKAPFPLRKIAMLQLAEDTGPNELSVMPYSPSEQYNDNLPEYRSRYRSFKKKLFDVQISFLDRLLEHCRDEGISVVLVNMPLTEDNVALMPPGFYKNYLNAVSSRTAQYGGRLIDLNNPSVFTKECFADSVHLNGLGGKRFFVELSERLPVGSKLAERSNSL